MYKILIALACALVALSSSAAETAGFIADCHAKLNVQCISCHKQGADQATVRKEQCLACHGSYMALAKRTEKVNPNPHYNHFGDRDCSTCHKGHSPSVTSCDQCHKFDLRVP